jgi:hypothetical protein
MGKPYKFAKLSVPVPVPTVSEVKSVFQKELATGGWTEEETLTLFEILASVGIRWPVVFDRFLGWSREREGRRERRVEELKARYYEVRRAVASAANPPSPSLSLSLSPSQRVGEKRGASTAGLDADDFTYPLSAELARRDTLDALLRRTAREAERERELTSGFSRIQLNFKRMHAMKPRILRACDDILHKCMPRVVAG